jgi:FKBP-type peptidyl-prolyl cis-trans isomerase
LKDEKVFQNLSQTKTKDEDDVSDVSSAPNAEDEHHHDEPWNEVIFKTNGEMPNHTPEAVIAELATIKKDTKVEGQGNNCLPDDFAKIHYKASLASNGLKVADTRAAGLNGEAAPKVFVIGHFDNIKCFDLILPQMKQGEEADVFCPYSLAFGNTEKYSQFGSDVIPA